MRSKVMNKKQKKSIADDKKQLKRLIDEEFKYMIDELGDRLTYKTTFEEFKELCKDDERFVYTQHRAL
jgi:hypothetical protein